MEWFTSNMRKEIKNFLGCNDASLYDEQYKFSTSCPANIDHFAKSFLFNINYHKYSPNSGHNSTRIMHNQDINLSSNKNSPNFLEFLESLLPDRHLMLDHFHSQKFNLDKKASSFNEAETMSSCINASLSFGNKKRSFSSSLVDGIKSKSPTKFEDIIIDMFKNIHIVTNEQPVLESKNMDQNQLESNSQKTKSNVNHKKDKQRKKNRKRRNRKKKNREKCESNEKKCDNEKIMETVPNNDDTSEKSLQNSTTRTPEKENQCFLSKFFSSPNDNDESRDTELDTHSIVWDEEVDDEENDQIVGSFEKEFAGNGLLISNLVSNKPTKYDFEFEPQCFLYDSPNNDDLDEELWVETPEEKEIREKMQALISKANREWDAYSLPSDHDDDDQIFAIEIKSQKDARRVQFDEEPVVWFIPKDQNDYEH